MQRTKVTSLGASLFALFVPLLWASASMGSVEERGDLGAGLNGRVFLYHTDSEQASPLPGLAARYRLNQGVDSERVKVLSRALDEGGMAIDVLGNGDYSYVGTTGHLATFDVSDPLNPVSVHEIDESAYRLDKAGSLMTAAMGLGGEVVLLDLSDPASPVEISRLSPPEGFFFDNLSMTDSLVVATGSGTLPDFGWSALMQVIDITDPYSPEVKSSLLGVSDIFRGVLIEQNLVFLTVQNEGLAIFDVTDPQYIIQLGFLTVYDFVDDMAYLDSLLYLSGRGMEIVDVSDPGDPTLVSQWGNAYTGGIVVSGGYAYITDDDDWSLHVVDVTDPFDPQEVSDVPAYGSVYNIDIDGNTVYLPDRVFGMLVVDVSDPLTPELLSMTPTGYYARSAAVDGDLAVANVNLASLYTLDVSDPYAPEVLGSHTQEPDSTPNNTFWQLGIDLSDSITVTSEWNGGIRTYDVSSPASPALLASLNLGAGFYPLAQVENLVYTGTTEIVIVDITDPANPVQVGTGPSFGTDVTDIQIVGDTGYASSREEVVIFDRSDPDSLVELSRISVGPYVSALAVDGDVLGLSRVPLELFGPSILELYDVSNPLAPELIQSLQDSALEAGRRPDVSLTAENGRFYMCGASHLTVVDATEPESAFVAATYPQLPVTYSVGWLPFEGVTASDGLIYLSGFQGVEILRFLDVGVFLEPDSIPVVVPPGGSFSYDARIENFSEVQQTFDAWIDVVLPGGDPFGPLAGPVSLTLAPGQSVTRTLEQEVPMATPPGTYFLYGHVGTYPDVELDNDRFAVEVE